MTNFTEKYLNILEKIELGLKAEYETNPNLTDVKLVFALENAIIAIKKEFGYARYDKIVEDNDTKAIIEHCVLVGKERINDTKDITLKNYVKCLERIIKSVNRYSQDGRRGYYEFVSNYL